MRTIEKYGRWTANDLPAMPTKRIAKPRVKPAQEQQRQYVLDIGKAISMELTAEQYGFAVREDESK